MSDEQEVEATMDDLWQRGVDQDKVNETASLMLLARGPYMTTPPMTVTAKHFDEDGTKPACTLYRAFGRITWAGNDTPMHKIVDDGVEVAVGAQRVGSVSFSFSPDSLMTINRAGQTGPDLATKLYAQLVKAYTRSHGKSPTQDIELKSYLENYPVKLEVGVIGGRDGDEARNMVFSVKAMG